MRSNAGMAKRQVDVDLRFAQLDVPLSAIPAFDSIAGLYNRHLNSNRGIL